MTQNAVVTALNADGRASVMVLRGTACGGDCHACGGTCSFKSELTVSADNPVGASVGDKVIISSRSSRIIGASALVYLLPLAAFFIGYAIAAALSLAESAAIIISVGAFLLGCLCVVIINKRVISKRPISFVITEITD